MAVIKQTPDFSGVFLYAFPLFFSFVTLCFTPNGGGKLIF